MPLQLPKAGTLNVPQMLAQALALHQQGRLAEAEPLYAAIVSARPDHVDALQMLGVVKLARGQPGEALRLVSAAMQVRKPSPQILVNYGLVLNALKRHEEALESFDRAIKQKSKYAEAHNNRGAALAALGRDEDAIESYRKAIAINRDYVEAHYNLGNSLRALNRFEDALASFDRALVLAPKSVKALNNRGIVLEALKRNDDALECYRQALALVPDYAEARNNRSRLLCALNRFDDALQDFGADVARNAQDAEAFCHRGKILLDLNRNDEAIAELQKALAIRPDYAEARIVDCMAELPIMYADGGEIGRRRAAYEQKLRALAADVEAGKLKADAMKALGAKQPFLLAYQGRNDRALQEVYGAAVSRVVARHYPQGALAAPPAPGEPVRVGIVSSFFYLHSNWKIPIKGWIEQLDRARFKIFGYHLGPQNDSETRIAAGMCDRFVHRPLDLDGWRREILADAPHVLIYPGLLMDSATLQLAAQRLAPVQLTSWGHPETSGLPSIDGFLSSDLMEPPEADSHYTERLIRLPNLSIYYEPVNAPPVAATREEFSMRADAAVFWCGQSLFKYLPEYDDVFARIAKRAPHSQFAFVRHAGGEDINTVFRQRLDAAFAAEGLVAGDHCLFLPRLSQSKFIAAIGQCDVFLDSIGWSGCNSTLESLPNNLPIVTMRGEMMRGRHSAAILQMMGVTETITDSVEEYVALAARLAHSPDERRALSEKIAASKDRLYHDRSVISALEDFLDAAARG